MNTFLFFTYAIGTLASIAVAGFLFFMATCHISIPLAAYFTKRSISAGVVRSHAIFFALQVAAALAMVWTAFALWGLTGR